MHRREEGVEHAGPAGVELLVREHLRDRLGVVGIRAPRANLRDRVRELAGIGPEVGEVVEGAQDALDAFVPVRRRRQRERDMGERLAPGLDLDLGRGPPQRRVVEALEQLGVERAQRDGRRVAGRDDDRAVDGVAEHGAEPLIGTPGGERALGFGLGRRREALAARQRECGVGGQRTTRPEHGVVAGEDLRRPRPGPLVVDREQAERRERRQAVRLRAEAQPEQGRRERRRLHRLVEDRVGQLDEIVVGEGGSARHTAASASATSPA